MNPEEMLLWREVYVSTPGSSNDKRYQADEAIKIFRRSVRVFKSEEVLMNDQLWQQTYVASKSAGLNDAAALKSADVAVDTYQQKKESGEL